MYNYDDIIYDEPYMFIQDERLVGRSAQRSDLELNKDIH